MEQNKNKRLDELFNQAKNEPSKVSYEATKKKFLKTSASINNVAKGGKLTNLSNLKILMMIITISAITLGGIMTVYNYTDSSTKVNDESYIEYNKSIELTGMTEESVLEEHEKVVVEYLQKVETLEADISEVNPHNKGLALIKKTIIPVDSLKRYQLALDKRTRTNQLLDTSYQFPKLNYEEIQANNKQKVKMFGKQKKNKKTREWVQPDPHGFLFIPMGSYSRKGKDFSVQAFYMEQTEVTNLEYRTFLFDLLIQARFEDFLMAKPDQEMWVKEYKYSFNKPMVDNYFSHPAYNEYPAVGMSRVGAEMYCKWMTEELNKVNQQLVNNVRLPTNFEWEYAAKGGLKNQPYPWGGPYIRNSKGCFLANFKPMKDNFIADGAFHTAKVDSYNPNDYGLYCMSGNVAEMVYYADENNLAGTKGGSWTSIGQELQIVDGKDRFKGQTTPSCNIGFRPVMTYLGRGRNEFYMPDITVTPPGTVKIDPNLYADKTEVTNFAWQEYVFWNKKTYGEESQQYKNSLADSTVWLSKLSFNQPYVSHYLNHPAYRNYPVVGITYEQAVAFCKWRTDRVKELFEIQKKSGKKNVYPTNFEYRLPTKQEWERIANAGYSEKTQKKIDGKYKGQHLINLKRGKGDEMGVAGSLNDNADITAPVESYFPNSYGIYNLIGNVAEMISEKGIAKGGSWMDEETDVTVRKDFMYKKQNEWVGFRCVLELKD